MKKENKRCLLIAICLLAAFLAWTLAALTVDVQAIGPRGSSVGFATLNRLVHNLTGVHMALYTVTDWLGLVPIFFAVGFAVLGLCEWIKRKHILRVDYSILVLGGFYIAVFAAYLLFEEIVVNYRPVFINGYLEASYPSSTTLLVMCVMPTAILQLQARIKCLAAKRAASLVIAAFIAFMVIGRLISGVHWFSDIVGGALLSAGLVMLYCFACGTVPKGSLQKTDK